MENGIYLLPYTSTKIYCGTDTTSSYSSGGVISFVYNNSSNVKYAVNFSYGGINYLTDTGKYMVNFP